MRRRRYGSTLPHGQNKSPTVSCAASRPTCAVVGWHWLPGQQRSQHTPQVLLHEVPSRDPSVPIADAVEGPSWGTLRVGNVLLNENDVLTKMRNNTFRECGVIPCTVRKIISNTKESGLGDQHHAFICTLKASAAWCAPDLGVAMLGMTCRTPSPKHDWRRRFWPRHNQRVA